LGTWQYIISNISQSNGLYQLKSQQNEARYTGGTKKERFNSEEASPRENLAK